MNMTMSQMSVTSFSALGHVHTLFLSGCDKVSDVSALEPWSHLRGGRNIFDNVVVLSTRTARLL
jgi:hypothetical protein